MTFAAQKVEVIPMSNNDLHFSVVKSSHTQTWTVQNKDVPLYPVVGF